MLRIFFISYLLLIVQSSFSQRNIDIQHYQFELSLTDQSDTITGKAIVLVKFIVAADQFTLDLSSLKAEKGMIVTAVTENNNPVEYSHQQDKISIKLSRKSKAEETKSFTIDYKGIPADGLIISKNKYGHRTFFADNWPNRGHNWIPCVDDPADKASVEFIITAPQHYQVVANGIQVEETNLPGNKKLTHWKEDVPVATKVMVIGAADFAVNLAGMIDNCIPVYSWVYPEDRDKGFYDFALAMKIVPFFINYIGAYGYKKLAGVQSKTNFGGLENANTIFYNENLVDGTRHSESLQAHEIAHQWFGNMVTEKSFAHLWLSEGFATYFAILYFEKKYGPDTAAFMLKEDRNQVIAFANNSDKTVVDNDLDFMELLNINSYQKGSWILHMLRRQLGDSVFHKSIKTYYAAYAGRNADTKDLQKIFEKESGKDLSVFFQQWLYIANIPTLEVSWSYLPKEKKVAVIVKQLQKTPFVFPLQIEFKNSAGNSQQKTISISKREESFYMPVKEKVISVISDPDTELLFDGTIEKK